jgi:uncharacterized integral membrane protein
MGAKTFSLIAGVIFAIVTLVNLTRVYMGWPVIIDTWHAPIWVSYIAIVVAGAMSYFAFQISTSHKLKR